MKKQITLFGIAISFLLTLIIISSASVSGLPCPNYNLDPMGCEMETCCDYDIEIGMCTPVAAGTYTNCMQSATCGGSNSQLLSTYECNGYDGECMQTNVQCGGNCDSYCVNGQRTCIDTSPGLDAYNICAGNILLSNGSYTNYTCSGQSISRMDVCGSGSGCGYRQLTCLGTCDNACADGSTTCQDTIEGQDRYNVCPGGYVCTGSTKQTINNTGICGAGPGCGYASPTSCQRTCSNYCTDGVSTCTYAGSGVNINSLPNNYVCGGTNNQTIYNSVVCDGSGGTGGIVATCAGTVGSYCVQGFGTCQNSCGDGICQPGLEDSFNCFKDCVAGGWTASGPGWFVGNGVNAGYLAVNGSNTITLYSDSFDLKVGKQYNLSARFYVPAGRTVTISVNMNCINGSGVTTSCGSSGYSISYGAGAGGWVSQYMLFTPPYNTHSINGAYFRGVRLEIRYVYASGSTSTVSYIANVSLKEIAPSNVYYNTLVGNALQTAGCCPTNYCWNGTVCVDSDLWMDDASHPPIWNNVIEENWDNNHVNTSRQWQTTGYRCVRNANGIANWTLSYIKYDWNYTQSGYCANNDDCFVDYDRTFGGASEGCTPHGTVMNEAAQAGSGNHYCYHGNWTTKSYIIATLFQNISTNKPYILHCYDDVNFTNNNNLVLDALNSRHIDIQSVCVLSVNNSDNVLAGVVLKDTASESGLLDAIADSYNELYPDAAYTPSYDCLTGATLSVNSNFSSCADIGGDYELKIYYDQQYKYFIIANYAANEIVGTTFWQNLWSGIKKFFTGIFGTSAFRAVPYTSINYTTSYDRIYIMRNSLVNVIAIEESKYDESSRRMKTLFYALYNGTNPANNPINVADIFNSASDSVAAGGGSILCRGYSINNSARTQEVMIQTDDRIGLWSYFTSVLRLESNYTRSTSYVDNSVPFNCTNVSSSTYIPPSTDCNYNGLTDNGEIGVDCGGGNCPDCIVAPVCIDSDGSCPNGCSYPADSDCPGGPPPVTGAIIIDHLSTDISQIPLCWIQKAKSLTFQYAHRSDGNNIFEGLDYLNSTTSNLKYYYALNSLPLQGNPIGIRMMDGNPPLDAYSIPDLYWNTAAGRTATENNWATGLYTASMWSWCNEFDEAAWSLAQVQTYLDTMNSMEAAHPNIKFIYMTSYTQNSNPITIADNQLVRDYAIANDKILYDFEDIGKYDPDGIYYPNADRDCTWCTAWCASHPSDCVGLPSCSHAIATNGGFICVQRGKAFWWLAARLAGWSGTPGEACPP